MISFKIPQLFLFPLASVTLTVFTTFGERPVQPNVLLLVTDDLGWQDVKCYDVNEPSPMETPNIDKLATEGVMFWQGYSPTPVCASSRAAILSGVHAARAQKTSVVGGAPPKPINHHFRLMDPWFSGRMPEDTLTIAKILQQHGYTTGHSGKWHIAIDHHAFPQPQDVGFDYERSSRGSRSGMKDRLKDFATNAPGDPYRLDANGYPFDQTNEDALTFLKENKNKPFFLYYATWLVHSPIHTRSEAHLKKYAEKLGVDPRHVLKKDEAGQLNPFYAAMVQELDYYVGQVFDYLNTTEDPRWPGHMLIENTYVIFTSDNGGMEGSPKERYTDNHPLKRGKISAMEGGTRVPLIIKGPGIPANVQTDVMANGLDFYPTILSMTGIEAPKDKVLDGCDLLPLLTVDPQDPSLVKESDGNVRDTMVWHFPHGGALESTIRIGDYKLIRNYDFVNNPSTPEIELYRLYDSTRGAQTRVDIEESKNLAEVMPEKAQAMKRELTKRLAAMKASYPSYNPNCSQNLPNKEKVPTVDSHQLTGGSIKFSYQEHGAVVVRADLIYTLNGGECYEEWFRLPAKITSRGTVVAEIPSGTTHCYLNLIDEKNFLVSYPDVSKPYTQAAVKVSEQELVVAPKH